MLHVGHKISSLKDRMELELNVTAFLFFRFRRKGSLQPITMTVKTRQGRKTITHVTGLETFSVDVDSFADEMRKLCAGSASSE